MSIHYRDPYHLTKLLKELSPRHIVMYDPNIEFVRQVEIYKATNLETFLKVYFIFYNSSVEEQVILGLPVTGLKLGQVNI